MRSPRIRLLWRLGWGPAITGGLPSVSFFRLSDKPSCDRPGIHTSASIGRYSPYYSEDVPHNLEVFSPMPDFWVEPGLFEDGESFLVLVAHLPDQTIGDRSRFFKKTTRSGRRRRSACT